MIPVRGFEGRSVAVFGLARTGLAAARALVAGGAEGRVLGRKSGRSRRGRGRGLRAGRPARRRLVGPRRPRAVAGRAADPSRAALDGRDGPGCRRGDDWRCRTFRPRRRRRARPPSPEGDRHHRHQRQVDHHRPGRPRPGARPAARLRIGGNIGVGVLGLRRRCTAGGLCAGAVLLPARPDLQPQARCAMHAEHHAGPSRPARRHGRLRAAKRRIFLNQGKGDTAVIGVDDDWGQRFCTEITAANRRTIWPISARKAIGRGVYALQGMLYDATGERGVIKVADLAAARSLPGRHNWQNAAAAYAAVRALGLTAEQAAAGLLSFPGLAHRMETVGAIGGSASSTIPRRPTWTPRARR